MAVFDFEGVSVAFSHEGSGAPVVFLHNLGADRSIWAAQVDVLKQTHSVNALDLFGFGESAIPDAGYTIENYLRLLTAFVDAHALGEVTLVGNCFGSALSLLYARQNPERVRALVLVNPLTAATLRPTKTAWLAWAARHLPLESVVAAVRLPSPVAALVVRDQLGRRGRSRGAEHLAQLRDRWTEPRRLLPVAAIARELPRLAELDTFRPDGSFPPITTIWGEQNRVLSAAAGARLNATLRPHQAIFLPHCGHLAMTEDPDAVTKAVQAAAGVHLTR